MCEIRLKNHQPLKGGIRGRILHVVQLMSYFCHSELHFLSHRGEEIHISHLVQYDRLRVVPSLRESKSKNSEILGTALVVRAQGVLLNQ